MRKINIMKSLRIKKDKIIIEDTNTLNKESQINEDLTDDFIAVGKSTADTVKNIARAGGVFSKLVVKNLLTPVFYLATKYWKGEAASLEGFIKNIGKNLDEFSKDVDSLVKDWDNDNTKMMNAAGFSKEGANTFMLAISPPLGIANLLYDTVYNKRSTSISKANIKNMNNMIDLIVYFIAFFITGKDNTDDAGVIKTLKTLIKNYITSIFNNNTHKVLTDLHRKEKWEIHGTNLKAQFKPITEKITFPSAFNDPIDAIVKLNKLNLNSETREVIKGVKVYCNNNYNKNESSIKTLNLKSKLILEKIENVDEISYIAFTISYMIFSNVKTQEKMMQAILNSEFGQKAPNLRKLLKARGNVKNIMIHLTMIYTNFVFCEFVMKVAEKLLDNKNNVKYDVLKDINSIVSNIKSDYFQGLPSHNQLAGVINKKIQDKIKSDFSSDNFKKNPIVEISFALESLINGSNALVNLPEFDYDVYKDGVLFNKLESTKFLSKDDEDFWRFIRGLPGINDIKDRAERMKKMIKDYIQSQNKQQTPGGSSTS